LFSARLILAATLLAVPSVLTGQSLTVQQSLSGAFAQDRQEMTFNLFQGSLGTLKRVHLTFNVASTWNVKATATELVPDSFGDFAYYQWKVDQILDVYSPNGSSIWMDYVLPGGAFNFSAVNETKSAQQTATYAPTISSSDPTLLAQFMGTGSSSLALELWPSLLSGSWDYGNGTVAPTVFEHSASGLLTFEYESHAVPEPGSSALALVGLVGLGVMARRRRA
jgi:MYXO-CTERM domain-containing protein